MSKKRMVISISKYGIGVTYVCYNGVLRYGKKCPDRDDGYKCMRCKYCKADMSAYDATRLLNVFGNRNFNEK